jgi:hypothetical protein
MRATQILTLGLLGAASCAASAGELGATSRGAVSISITVPPHVTIKPAGAHAPEANALCVMSNGFDHYHLVLLEAGGSRHQSIIPSAGSKVLTSGARGGCRSIGTDLMPDASLAEDAASRRIAVTFLIVPD